MTSTTTVSIRLAATILVSLLAARGLEAASGLPEVHTLENGLDVVLFEDHTLPQVAVSLWVRAGSKDEIESSAGYAHFLEHLVQRRTATSAPPMVVNQISE